MEKKAKILFKIAKFNDKILRKMEPRIEEQSVQTADQYMLNKALKDQGKDRIQVAKLLIQTGLQSLNLGYLNC